MYAFWETRASSYVLSLYQCVFYKISKIDTSCILTYTSLRVVWESMNLSAHDSIWRWRTAGMNEIFWWEPLPWDHTREISNTNSCINDINELLFYKKKKKKIGSKSIHYNTFSLNLPHFSELPYNSHFLIYHDVWKKYHWNIV